MVSFVIFFLFFLKTCSAVIYSVNESEYATFPALYDLDDFETCMLEPDAVYCVGDYDLFSDEPSELMRILQEYSEHTLKHFNHTQIHRGVCVMRRCKKFLKKHATNNTLDLESTLTACLNDSVWNDYEIQARLNNIQYCEKAGEKKKLDYTDAITATAYLILILLNVIGSYYDSRLKNNNNEGKGNPYLLAFSVRRNWNKLIAPNERGTDPRIDRLKLFNALRALTMVCVFFSHASLAMSHCYIANPLFVEKSYEDPLKQILFNGTLVTQSFFVMSAFLLSYNLQIYSEKHTITWMHFPKGVLLRYLRLTPIYALMLGTVATFMRYLGEGPLWQLMVTSESMACRKYWWAHMFYFNNYVYDDALCSPQTWYLASDTQMFCVGLLFCVMARTPRSRKIALFMLMVASFAVVAAHTYYQDLNAVVLQTPEAYRTMYSHDDTFRLIYTRGHTNMSTYTLGLAAGFFTYYLQTEKKNIKSYKSFRWYIWMTFPLCVMVILSGAIFYVDGSQPSTAVRVLYATFYKFIFQIFMASFIIGCILKVESVYRGIVEWRGFTWCGRVSYISFFVHTLFQRAYLGFQTTPYYMSGFNIATLLFATVFVSFVTAALLWITVEAPLNAVTKALLEPQRPRPRSSPAQTSLTLSSPPSSSPVLTPPSQEQNGQA
ncbi:nose resistant to fluoxetine protein 6-like [Galleria mellonella]|uniref:Nose resistant to fluoxetine protein 6-like n=1 Tax=Galleria mellonella TaxID=7137 RepID=A0A6J1WMX1_GALME|nr:nose resistant to fluoxetine protein 6-like [Galleria mellonella]